MEPERSFEEYVRTRGPALSRVAYLLTGDHYLAEDLVQHALLRVVGDWHRLVARGDPDPYVRRILYHQHVSWWRQSRRVTVRAVTPERIEPDPTDAMAEALAIRQALRLLPPRQRAVLVLRYFEDLTEAQTADVLGIRIGTVKSQARDGLARLRDLVRQHEPVRQHDLVRQHDPVRQHDLMPGLVPLSPTEARTEVRPQAPTEVRP